MQDTYQSVTRVLAWLGVSSTESKAVLIQVLGFTPPLISRRLSEEGDNPAPAGTIAY